MRLDVWKGDAARARLSSPEFREEWDRLYAECPWGSVFQSYGFASAWYDVYRRFTPLLVGALDADATLRGLLPLAIGGDGRVVMAGAHQAEYQVWLARPGDGDAFIEAALGRLAGECPGRTLTLRYLPPDTPRDWLASRRGIARRCVLRAIPRGIMDIGQAAPDAALGSKKNRYNLKRLERFGPVVYERLTDPVAIDSLLEEMAPLCDLRHGALHGIMPFRDDPLKAPFHRALARVPGLLHVSVLRCGREIACAGIDADNRGQVALGFAAFSPFLSRHSPRRLHLLSLARDLGQRGHTAIDFTPGEDPFKNEWATRFDEAYTLRVFFSGSRFALHRAADAARRSTKTVLAMARMDPAGLRERLERLTEGVTAAGHRRAPTLAARALRRRVWSDEAIDLYEFGGDTMEVLSAGRPMNRDRVSELLSYRPGVLAWDPRRVFLWTALKRLEHGARVFTRVEGGDLVACGWVSACPSSQDRAELLDVVCRAAEAALVHDVLAGGRFSTPEALAPVLGQLVRGAADLSDTGRVLVAAPRARAYLRQAAEQLGGRYVGSIYRRTRAGRTRATSTFVPSPEAAQPRPTFAAADDAEQAVVHRGAESD